MSTSRCHRACVQIEGLTINVPGPVPQAAASSWSIPGRGIGSALSPIRHGPAVGLLRPRVMMKRIDNGDSMTSRTVPGMMPEHR
jgi:hypothetical protein